MEINKIGQRNIVFTYNLDGWSLNLHIIKGDKFNFVIDTGLGAVCGEDIKQYLDNDKKPIIVINTHHHWDHIWGNCCFEGTTIMAHSCCGDLIKSRWDTMFSKSGSYAMGDVKLCLPTMVFDKRFSFVEEGISLFYTPGHTIDSISVFDEKDKVLNVGDNIGDSMEYLVPSLEIAKDVYLQTLKEYMTFNCDYYISGHNLNLSKEILVTLEKELA